VSERPDVDALYELPPEQFVAARDALAKVLRSQGDRAGASGVVRRRRPPASAWALNQVARVAPRLIDDLLAAGNTLRAAMSDAMAGDASSLRRAEAGERAAVDAILTSAGAQLDAHGQTLTDVHRQRMTATLRAAVLDEQVAAPLQGGVLDSDHEAPPFGFGADLEVVPRTPTPSPKRQVRPDPAAIARERARKAEHARVKAEAGRLQRRADRLEEEADNAARRAAELKAKATDAAAAAAAMMAKLTETGP
jgi:hypothetical protein